jgi:hypothetical protein
MDFEKPFVKFLENYKFLPMSSTNSSWQSLEIAHTKTVPSLQKKNSVRLLLKNKLEGHPGLYAYLDAQGKLLYVGKASNIFTRVYSHYRESFAGDGVWHEFFSDHAGALTVLWREVKTDRQRRAIEEMIEEVQKPEFERIYPRRKRKPIRTS